MKVLHSQSIVVLGAMNPAIHHPAWYHLMSIISQAEFDESLHKQVIVSPPTAQFTSKGFSVACLPDRWQVSCEEADAERIVALAKATFDKLYHTPVTAYGVNHDFHTETAMQIAPALMKIVRRTALPFPPDETGTAEITYAAEGNGCRFTTVISASPRGAQYLSIRNNAHFVIPQTNVEQFDLGPLLDDAFHRNEDRSQSMLANLVNAIQGLQ